MTTATCRSVSTPLVLLCCLFLLFPTAPVSAALILSAPPRETPAVGQKDYRPIAAYLSKLWGTQVIYKHPPSWLDYQRDMRDDKYDVVFDGPHFADWRMVNLGNRVAVRLPGSLQFILFVHTSDKNINKPSDLIGKPICAMPPPNLTALVVINQFPNPARQPVLHGIRGGPKRVMEAFDENGCVAAVLGTIYAQKRFTAKERAATRVIFTSKRYPNQSITVSKRVSDSQLRAMIKGLTQTPTGIAATRPLIKRWGGKAKHFIPAGPAEFNGLNKLLEGVIFGW